MSRRKGKSAPRAAATAGRRLPRVHRAFLEIESELRDLPRIARLADEQLHRAIGELGCAGRKYTEVPDYAEVELALFAVSKVAQMAKDLESQFDRIYSEAAKADAA
jgi:hypothetical protein